MSIAALLTLGVFLIRNWDNVLESWEDIMRDYNEDKYIKQYGRAGKVYAIATIKKLQIEDIKIERHDKVKFFVPFKDMFVEGIFVGVGRDGLLYIRMDNEITDDSGDITVYQANCLKKGHIVYVKPLST